MASKLDICNMALGLLGCKQINDIDSPSTEEERACDLWWDTTRDQVLEDVDWRFARQRSTLSATTAPDFEYDYAYQLPNDYIKNRGLWDDDNGEMITDNQTDTSYRYEIENRQLLTDLEEVNLIYTARIENTGLFPTAFIECMILKLAANMAPKLTSDGKPRRKDLLEEYRTAKLLAEDSQGNDNYFISGKKDSWLDSGGFSEFTGSEADETTIFDED